MTDAQAEFRDRRLAEVYDAQCLWAPDDDFFLDLVSRRGQAQRVLDLGCGTGRLTIGIAAAGHRVTGIDPAAASLDAARAKPGARPVTWIAGTSADAPSRSFDAALMTSHVAQFFLDDDEWAATLADLKRALVPGGVLAFDSRDPAARRWEAWNPADSRHRLELSDGGSVEVFTEVTGADGGLVSFVHHYAFSDGDRHTSAATLRFRSLAELRGSLRVAGFALDAVYGGWRREPVGSGVGEYVVVASA
jgi:SAM-dependent methyltransferase